MPRPIRITIKPRRYEDEKFLPCTNNGYTAGRRIDPGFAINGNDAPFDTWAKNYHACVNESRPDDWGDESDDNEWIEDDVENDTEWEMDDESDDESEDESEDESDV